MEGFDATIRACESMGLDVSNLPMAVLQAFYVSGIAFAEQSGMSPEERQVWRNSVIWPARLKPNVRMEAICVVAAKR